MNKPSQGKIINPDPMGVAACDDCTLCCEVIGMEVEPGEARLYEQFEDGSLPPWIECQFCSAEDGCGIYEEFTRPERCRIFECWWLQSQRTDAKMAEAERPDNLGAVITSSEEAGTVTFSVPVHKYGDWNRKPMKSLIARLGAVGLPIFVACGDYRLAVSPAAISLLRKTQEEDES